MAQSLRLTRRRVLGLIGATCLAPNRALAGDFASVSGPAFGTGWRITTRPDDVLPDLANTIARLFDAIDTTFSPWRTDSKISAFNRAPQGAYRVDREFGQVTKAALEIARRSEGTFDPTVGPLVARWGFGPITSGGTPDWRGVKAFGDKLDKARGELTLDLCGIAKGWALDRAVALASDYGIKNLLFELGGEFRAVGRHPAGRDWRVAVATPPGLPRQPAILRLPAGAAAATSGTQTQSYRHGGQIYTHIISPTERRPVAGNLKSVTVVADSAMSADGWATALFAAGGNAGPDLAKTEGISALFLFEDEDRLRSHRTGEIGAFIL